MNTENKHLDIILKNYEMVFDHYKDQDQLRNTAFGFFTTITLAASGIIGIDKINIINVFIFLVIFIVGIIVSIIICRYRCYALFYSNTLSVFRKLSLLDDDSYVDREYIRSSLKEKNNIESNNKKGKKKLYSADFLLYMCLIIINSLNLFIFTYMAGTMIFNSFNVDAKNFELIFYIIMAVIVVIYISISYKAYAKLVNEVIQKSLDKEALNDYYFLDMYTRKTKDTQNLQ